MVVVQYVACRVSVNDKVDVNVEAGDYSVSG